MILNKNIAIAVGIIAVIVAGISVATVLTEKRITEFSDAVSSGPVTILQYEHKLGDNVYMHVRGLDENNSGEILIFTPRDVLFKTIVFDGSLKQDFNVYFKPKTSIPLNICTPEELVGNWTVTFFGINYPPVEFKVTDEFMEGAERDVIKVC